MPCVSPEIAVLVRPATASDIPHLLPLLAQLFALEPDYTFDEHKAERALSLLCLPGLGHVVLVAVHEQAVLGMLSLQTVISTAEGAPSLWLEDFIVERIWRGRGIGRQLLQAAEDWASEQGATRIQLLADQQNDQALRFYARRHYSAGRMMALRRRI